MAEGERTRRRPPREQLSRDLKAGQPAPCYLLHGPEGFERDRTCTWLLDALAPPAVRAFNLDVFRGDSLVPERVLEAYLSYPMMAERRVVLVKDAERLSADQCRLLEPALEHPSPTSVLVVVGDKVDQRRGLYRSMGRLGTALEFRVPFDRELPGWVREYARSQGLQLDPDAAGLLPLCVGANLRELASEIDKLALYVAAGTRISRQMVEEVVGLAPGGSAFKLAEAVGQRDYRRAIGLLHRLLAQGEEPLRSVALITRHLQVLLRLQDLAREGVPKGQLAARVGVPPFFLEGYLEQARRYPRTALWQGLCDLREADAALKSQGRRQGPLAMDLLLHRLCTAERVA